MTAAIATSCTSAVLIEGGGAQERKRRRWKNQRAAMRHLTEYHLSIPVLDAHVFDGEVARARYHDCPFVIVSENLSHDR